MNAPPATARGGAASLALALADALSLGLPGPDYITMHPHLAGSATATAIDFQFNGRHGQEPLAAMHAWASRFGVTVDASAGSADPAVTWHEFDFTHAGIRIHAYAQIAGDEPLPDCARCGHPEAGHRRAGQPSAPGGMCLYAGCECDAYAASGMQDPAPVVRVLPGDQPVTAVYGEGCDGMSPAEISAAARP